jgi:KDO2-lipid IV(A) lauroyltransferase
MRNPTKQRLALLHPRYWPSWIGLLCLRCASFLPLPILWLLGSGLGQILYHLHRERRTIVSVNIEKCFPHWPEKTRRRLTKQHFRALGQGLFDTTLAWWAPPKRLQRLVRFAGREHYDQALARGDKIILLVAHCVAVELGGIYLSHERPVVDMYKKAKNRLFDSAFYLTRTRFGARLVEQGEGLRPVIAAIKQGAVFYYLPDQDPGRHGTVFVPFFGVQTATLTALSRLAKLTGSKVLPCFTRQLAYGRGYEIIFQPPLTNFPSGDLTRDAERMNREIEGAVLATPAQYFWVHKRFKTRPAGEAGFYAKT